jgi:hypothetical protein
MLSIDLADVRDFVIVIYGIIHILFAAITVIIAVLAFYFGRKGMAKAHELMNTRVVGVLGQVNNVAVKVRDRTALLPGAPGGESSATAIATAVSDLKQLKNVEPPFERKVKSWRPF